jgi:hypothetical protein
MKKQLLFLILSLLVTFLTIQAQSTFEFQKLLSSTGGSNEVFGFCVDVDGDYAVIGADGYSNAKGAAFIFKNIDGVWTETAVITPEDASVGDSFGISADICDNYVIVGAHGNDDNGTQCGAAYIYKRIGENWEEVTKLYPSDAYENQKFGIQVCLNNQYAAVSNLEDEVLGNFSGSVYIFERNGEIFTEKARLFPDDQAEQNYFGKSISLYDNSVIAGAPWESNHGSAYIFENIEENWTQTAKLTITDYEGLDNFGYSVAITDQYAIAGSIQQNEFTGSAYIFNKPETGWVNMTESAKLTASDGAEDDTFGSSVDISNDFALVGASSQYTFNRTSSVYLFKNENNIWNETSIFKASDGEYDDRLGFSCKLSGDTAFAGAIYDDDNGNNSGAVYVFTPLETNIHNINSVKFSIFPNPSDKVVYIKFNEEKPIERLTISDITGRQVFEKANVPQNIEIDLSHFKTGIYILNIQTEKGINTSKIIKR